MVGIKIGIGFWMIRFAVGIGIGIVVTFRIINNS